jgi:hypothetical protein
MPHTPHAHCTKGTSMLHVPRIHAYAGRIHAYARCIHAYAGCIHAAHAPLHISNTCCMDVTFTQHSHLKHAIHISQTCLTQASRAPNTWTRVLYVGCTLPTCTQSCMHTFMHAQAYYMQERHKLAAHTLYAPMMYACSMQTTLKLPTCHTHLYTDVTHATSARMLQTCQRHTLCAFCMQTTSHTCMHACHTQTTYIARTLMSCTMQISTLHACTLYPHMQATCCCMFTSCRTNVNTSHACTRLCCTHTSQLHAHFTQAHYTSTSCHLKTAHVYVYRAFGVCLCACCLCLQHA